MDLYLPCIQFDAMGLVWIGGPSLCNSKHFLGYLTLWLSHWLLATMSIKLSDTWLVISSPIYQPKKILWCNYFPPQPSQAVPHSIAPLILKWIKPSQLESESRITELWEMERRTQRRQLACPLARSVPNVNSTEATASPPLPFLFMQ